MKRFVVRFIYFVVIIIALIAATVGGTIYIMSQASFKIDPSKNILVLGESLTEFGINDSIFTRSVNLSQSANAYMYSYCKLKKVLENNQHIDTVLLSFKYTMLTKKFEDVWIMSENSVVFRVPFFVTLLGKDEFLTYDKKKLLQAIIKIPIRNIGSIIKYLRKGQSNFSYKDLRIGGYVRVDMNNLEMEPILPFIGDLGNAESSWQAESPMQKEYLYKIIDLCKKYNVELILLSTPIYNPEVFGNIDKMNEYHLKYLNGIKMLNYTSFALPDEYYRDIIHLNYKGADVFSKYLQENLTNDLKKLDEKE